MKNSILYTLLSGLLLLSGCITEVKFDEALTEKKLVVQAILTPDSVFEVKLSHTRPIVGIQKNYYDVRNATVSVFENDQFLESLKYVEYFDTIYDYHYYYDEAEDIYYEDRFILEIDTISKYIGIKKPSLLNEYKIEVSADNYQSITAKTTFSKTVEIVAVDTIAAQSKYDDNMLEVKLKFKDPINDENFYRLKLINRSGRLTKQYIYEAGFEYQYDHIIDSIQYISVYTSSDSYIQSDDIVLTGENGADDILFGTPYNRYNIFDDQFIDGKEYELNFYLSRYNLKAYGNLDTSNGEFFSTEIVLESLSKEYFLYLQSYTNYEWIDGNIDMFVEPVQVYNNIENGAGIFGSYSSDKYSFVYGQYPKENVDYVYINY